MAAPHRSETGLAMTTLYCVVIWLTFITKANKAITMIKPAWVNEFPGKIEVCDRDGILPEMNDRVVFSKEGALL